MNAKNANKEFDSFYQKEYPRLLGYIRKHFQKEYGWMDEEDLLQEVTFNVLKKLDPAKPIENIGAYLYSAISNRIRDLFRKKKLATTPFEDFHSLLEISDDEDLTRDLYAHPEFVHAMMMAIYDLPDFERDLIEKTSLEGYTFQQLSEAWDIPVGTLLSRKHRILAKLQRQLDPVKDQIINS